MSSSSGGDLQSMCPTHLPNICYQGSRVFAICTIQLTGRAWGASTKYHEWSSVPLYY